MLVAASVTRRIAGVLEESAITVCFLKAPAVPLWAVRTGMRSRVKWKAVYVRKHLLLKGMLIHSLSY